MSAVYGVVHPFIQGIGSLFFGSPSLRRRGSSGEAPRVVWMHRKYLQILRSDGGRANLQLVASLVLRGGSALRRLWYSRIFQTWGVEADGFALQES